MELIIQQQIYYSNKEPVPIKEVAESLIALERIIRQSPGVLEALFPGTEIQSIEVYIEQLKSDSLWEDVVVKFIFGSQQQLDIFISSMRERVGMGNLMNNSNLLSVILLAMILSGGFYYLGRSTEASPEQKATLEMNHNIIIQFGADMIELEHADFKTIIENGIKDKDKKSLVKDVVSLIKPTKRDPQATITFGDNDNLRISKDSIRAMPSYIEESDEEPDTEDFNNIELEIRATDLDSSKQGWGVIIPELHPKRVRMTIDPFIDTIELGNRRTLRANITVVFGYDRNGNRIPKLVFLREVSN